MKKGMIGKNKHDLVYRSEPCIVKIDEDTLQVNDVDKLIEILDELRLSARDMFKMLGYKPYNRMGKQEENIISYYRYSKIESFVFEKEIEFDLTNKMVHLWADYEVYITLTLNELTAINKQIEELRVVEYGRVRTIEKGKPRAKKIDKQNKAKNVK